MLNLVINKRMRIKCINLALRSQKKSVSVVTVMSP